MAGAPPESRFTFSRDGLARLGRLVRKELAEILRDRRTILTLVGMPILLYPLMTVAFQQYFKAVLLGRNAAVYQIGCTVSDKKLIDEIVLEGETPTEKSAETGAKNRPQLRTKPAGDPDELLQKNEVDIVIRLLNAADIRAGKTGVWQAKAVYQPDSAGALTALNLFERRLAVINRQQLEKLAQTNPNYRLVKLQHKPLPSSGAGGTLSLASLVPLILILMTITGAVYPAIDLTAGERERGTLEILVAAPVPRLGLLFAKYVAVVTVAILTALINLLAMIAVLTWSGLAQEMLGQIPLSSVFAIFALLILFAAFFSAMLLVLTSFARSFKEAQAYLIPLMLASLGPGLIGIMPGLELTGLLAVTPLLNIVLLTRDIFKGGAEPMMIVLVITSTLAYAAIALSLAARIFGAEEVLYSEQAGWSDLWRRPRQARATATVSGALICLAFMVPGNFLLQAAFRVIVTPLVASSPQAEAGTKEAADSAAKTPPAVAHKVANDAHTLTVILSALSIMSVVLFILYPLLAAYLGRVDIVSGFSLTRVPWAVLAGGALLGLSLWPFVIKLLAYLHGDTPPPDLGRFEELLKLMRDAGLAMTIPLGLAAVSEEFFFRGYLFTALSRANKPLTTIVLTAGIFGLMHCLAQGDLGKEQLLPATLLGIILGTVRWYSGSVLPGMALHLVHNVMLAIISNQAARWVDANNLPAFWIFVGSMGVPLGAGLIFWGMARKLRGEVLRTSRVPGYPE